MPSIDESCREALAGACRKARQSYGCHSGIGETLAELQSRDTYMANYLLLRIYTAGAKHFADNAVSELCDKTWRFHCGYSNSPYWIAVQLIEAIAPLCSDESRARLENTILDYVPHYERTPRRAYRLRGCTSFTLCYRASRLNCGVRMPRLVIAELERKFGAPEFSSTEDFKANARSRAPLLKSPQSEKMTDEQWLRAIKKYDSEERRNWQNLERGGGASGACANATRARQRRVGTICPHESQIPIRYKSSLPGTLPHGLEGNKRFHGT